MSRTGEKSIEETIFKRFFELGFISFLYISSKYQKFRASKMWHFSTFLLLAILAFLHPTEGRVIYHNQVEEKSTAYDKLALVHSWAPGYCKKEACTIPTGAQKIWTIHGLWPFVSGSKVPPSCTGTYDGNLLSSIKTELKQKWPTYKTGSTNNVFWEHEYTKHGVCAADLAAFDTQFKYFDETMDLYDQYDIKAILAAGATPVKPSSTLQYNLADITSALKKGLGVDPAVYCVEKKTEQYLWEVRMCFDKKLKSITCGADLVGGGKCHNKKKIVYLPF